MKLGILVNTDKNLEDVIGITKAALSKGHELYIFAMDIGTKLLEKPSYTELSKLEGVTMAFCDLSSKNVEANTEGLPEEIDRGDQYRNAIMNNTSDKMIIL